MSYVGCTFISFLVATFFLFSRQSFDDYGAVDRRLFFAVAQIVCRSPSALDDSVKDKISMFCHVPAERVINVYDCSSVWKVPLLLIQEGMLDIFRDRLQVKRACHASLESGELIFQVSWHGG
jgi:CTP synthase (UTP-ammonia lyase)